MATSSDTYFAPSWADLDKDEREATGMTKKEYNKATGQGKHEGSTPDLEYYDTTGYGSGSEKGKDKLSKADLKNLEAQGYSKQEIIDYSDEKTSSGTAQGEAAQNLLNRWITDLSEPEPDTKEDTGSGIEDVERDQFEQIEDTDDPTDPIFNPGPEIITVPEITTGPGTTDPPSQSDNDGDNTAIGVTLDNGSALTVGNGSSTVGGKNVVSDIQTIDKDFDFQMGNGDFINTGNVNSDFSRTTNNNQSFIAGGATQRSDAMSAIMDDIAYQGYRSQGNPDPAARIDYTQSIPNPLDIINFTQGSFQGNVGELQANANLYGDSVFGRYWPIAT